MIKPLLKALQREKVHSLPVWFMRQAGRYLPEYQAIRAKHKSFLEMCFSPDVAAEVTLQPLKRFAFDAAILFSDILVIPEALGQKVEFLENHGPQLAPFSLASLSFDRFEERLQPVVKAIPLIKQGLSPSQSLIGFVGAPWTLATYMIEEKTSKNFNKIKAYAFTEPQRFSTLLAILEEACLKFLKAQIEAGVEVVQIFDTWAGVVPEAFVDEWIINPLTRMVKVLKEAYPHIFVIAFPKGLHSFLPSLIKKAGVDALSLDSSLNHSFICDILQPLCVTQGTLDPHLLKAGGRLLEQEVKRLLALFSSSSHIFNLGHGILPETPLSHVEKVLELIRA